MIRTNDYIKRYSVPVIKCIKSPQNSPTTLIELKGSFTVFLNVALQLTDNEIKTALCHEYGHIKTGCTHRLMSDYDLISQHEYKANAYAYQTLMPISDLMDLFASGITEPHAIAEALELPEAFVKKGYEYHMHHSEKFRQYVWRSKYEEEK